MNISKILRSVLAAVLTLVATTASASDFTVDGIWYAFNGYGTVCVTYKGSYSTQWNEYSRSVVIPNSVTYSGTTYSVTSIGDSAFYGCSGLTSVTIPDSVTSIGESAFSGCSGLTSVTIPNSVTSIGNWAFYNCSGLTSVTIPNSVTSIGGRTFSDCSGLTSVTIPNSVTSIGDVAFYGCSRLTSVTIPDSVTSIGWGAFSGCSGLTSVIIGNSVTSIGGAAFRGCSGLTSVTIPNSVTSIGDGVFWNCSGLTSVTIPNSVTSIGESAFRYCYSLTRVIIPYSVTSIGSYAFEGCRGLESIVVESGNSKYDSRDNCNAIIEMATRTLLVGCKNTTIPNSVTSIGDGAFMYCSGLTSVTIPNSVTSIGDGAFMYCSGLTSVTIPNSVTSIGESAFRSCYSLTSVTIGDSVTTIGSSAFSGCSGLETIFYNAENCADDTYNSRVFSYGTNIIIGKDVKKVPNYLFYGLDNAPTSVISKSVTPPTCGANTFNSKAYAATLYVPSTSIDDYMAADVWKNFTTIEIEPNDAENVADLIEGTNMVKFGLQGVKMHGGVLYACTTAESVNKSTPTLHGNNAVNMDTYEDRNFADFDQRDWVAISGLEGDFEDKELSYPFVAQFSDGVLTPSWTITATADATAYALNTFRAENILHGGYSNYTESDYKAYYVPARVNEVAKFMGFIETVGGVKYLYSDNVYGRKDGEGIKVEGNIADNSKLYRLLEGILVADASTKAGVKIIMLQDLGVTTTASALSFTVGGIKYITNGDGTVSVTRNDYSGVVVIPNSVTYSGTTYSVTSIGDSAFYRCIDMTSVIIPNSVTSIGESAFYGCSGLTRVIIPYSVTSIGSYAFEGCSGLTSVTIPNSVTSIGGATFRGCSGLTRVIIPNSVTSIGGYAFSGCSGLESIVVESGNSKYDSRDNCNAIIEMATRTLLVGCKNTIIPNSVTSIGDGAFMYCSGLTSLTIGNSVISIGESAFYGCGCLTSVTIPDSVTSIGRGAFYGCSGLETIFYNAEICADVTDNDSVFTSGTNIIIGKDVKKVPNYLFYGLDNAPTSVISKSVSPPTCGANTFNSKAYTATLYVPSTSIYDYMAAAVWVNFTTIEIEPNDAENVADLIEGTNMVNFGLQGVKMHGGVLYACTTAESVNKSTPTLHGNNAVNMDSYEDRNFADFDQRDWVAISGLEGDFEGKELSYPFVAQFADGVLAPSGTITATADSTAYALNTFRAENILHGGYSNYTESDYKAYYVPARVNEVAKFMGFIETVGEVKYLYSDNAYGRKDGEGIKVDGNIADNSKSYSLLEGILVADASTKAGVKIIMLQDLGVTANVEGVAIAARIYTANGNIIIVATEDGEVAVYDCIGRLITSVPVASGDSTAVPVTPGCYIVKTGTKTQSLIVK